MEARLVRNISDTARWVATYRARETKRRDALFRDPLAERLAGERGPRIAALASSHSAWALITRTKLIDDLVLASVRDGCDRVLNLAAGFDTRPYRLELPSELVWIEGDLAPLVAEKNELLKNEVPRCRLERSAVDLADPALRAAFLAGATQGAKKTLVITEGLVVYLEESVVAALARDFAERGIDFWILDVSSPRILKDLQRQMRDMLANAPMKFGPPNGVAFFEERGFRARDIEPIFHRAGSLKRLPLLLRPFAYLPEPDPRKLGTARWSAVVRFERAQ
jgi:methyltransferase (TIGR00027 family)